MSTQFIKQLRAFVWERCHGLCERCAIPLNPDDWALHHRQLKSRGGTDDIVNVVALHHHCHNMGTHSVHLRPKDATRRGLIVSSWSDPAQTPLILDDGTSVILTSAGTYQRWDGNNE